MKKLVISIFLLIFSTTTFAQQKSFSGDLRTKKVVFELESHKSKKTLTYKLEKSTVGEFSLSHLFDTELQKTWKLTKEKAQKLDDSFFNQFLSLKYDMKAYTKKKCEKLYSLTMHSSDYLKICKQDKERVKIITQFLKNIQKEFK